MRRAAARALGHIHGDALITVPAVAEAIRDQDFRVREAVAQALERMREQPLIAVPALAMALKDGDPLVAKAATDALQEFGPNAKIALNDLIDLLNTATRPIGCMQPRCWGA